MESLMKVASVRLPIDLYFEVYKEASIQGLCINDYLLKMIVYRDKSDLNFLMETKKLLKESSAPSYARLKEDVKPLYTSKEDIKPTYVRKKKDSPAN